MLKTLREIGKVLAWAEHPTRNVRCNANDPLNKPYYRMNTIGEWIVKLCGGWGSD